MPWSFSARRRRFGSPRPPPAAARRSGEADAVVGDGEEHDEPSTSTLTEARVAWACLPDVGQGLPDCGKQVLKDEVVDGGVERARERQTDLEAHDLMELAHEVGDVVADAPAVLAHPELVNRGTNLRDDLVDLGHGTAQLVRRGLGQAGGQALQGQAQSEQPLDDRVVEVPGHAVAVLVDRRPAHPVVEAGVLDGDAGGQRQRPDQCLVVEGELRPPDLVGQVEVPVDLVAHLDRHAEEGRHGRVVRAGSRSCRDDRRSR